MPCVRGECVIETDALLAPAVLGAVRLLEQPYILAFNRGRLMALRAIRARYEFCA